MTRHPAKVDIAALLPQEYAEYLALLPDRIASHRWGGLSMSAAAVEPDPDDDPADDDVEPVDLNPDDVILVGSKKIAVKDLRSKMANEKRQGRRAGVKGLLSKFGFDTEEELEAALAGSTSKPPKKAPAKTTGGDGDDAAVKAAEERAEAAERELEKERAAIAQQRRDDAKKARTADIKGALRSAGVRKDDLDDAILLVNKDLDEDYDDDDLADVVEDLRGRRSALFAEEGDDGEPKQKKRTTTTLPPGGPRRRPAPRSAGSAGEERARRKGWIKDKD